MVWVGRDPKAHPVQGHLPPVPGGSRPHPAWPWTLRHGQKNPSMLPEDLVQRIPDSFRLEKTSQVTSEVWDDLSALSQLILAHLGLAVMGRAPNPSQVRCSTLQGKWMARSSAAKQDC